ncbi:tyrosine-type recombinase/integrase [Pelodictyon luteolum]|uniref:Site-specific recombinase XerD-like protein n=1 Tax=Chlorobium luteolum (strain DSM 273 / BCRC 81028 / 2530) TaxID=319225 RepID=Q3B1Q0_CHLL3|nr:tyrosine-type recombinase/integrase [Pelodictyon luteolum]ABB24731.1 Site-specific recombinase XerD-like protein [Pelodictyon luteolum DSM 273]
MQKSDETRQRFLELIERLDGAYAPNTIRAYRADMEEFIGYCDLHGLPALPAEPSTIARFLESVTDIGIKSSSIRRKSCSISIIHQLSDLEDPTKSEAVKIALRKVYRKLGRRFTEARPITRPMLEAMLPEPEGDLRSKRDRALLLIAYDSLRRRQELTSLRTEDIAYHEDFAIVQLRKNKDDRLSTGHWIRLGNEATLALKAWLDAAGIEEGYIIRGVTNKGEISAELGARQIGRIVNRLARAAGFDAEMVQSISSNSLRIGGAQDLLRSGATFAQIMQKGGWDKTDTLLRYLERTRQPGMICEEGSPYRTAAGGEEDIGDEADNGEKCSCPGYRDTLARRRFQSTLEQMEGAYAPGTLVGYHSGMESFIRYCEEHRLAALPASPMTVADFIGSLSESGMKSRTIQKKVEAISVFHRLGDHDDPTRASYTRIAMRKVYRKLGRQARQAYGITRPMLEGMMQAAGDRGIHTLCDRALLLLAYDSLRRRQELVGLRIEDLEYTEDGAVLLLRKSKTDQYGVGHWIHLNPETACTLKAWIEAAGLTEGFILRTIDRKGEIKTPLRTEEISAIYKRLAEAAGLDAAIVGRISSHSMRVGAAQDMLNSGATLTEIMQKGGWMKSDTVMRYIDRTRPPGLVCEDEETKPRCGEDD